MKRSFYQMLGVESNADQAQIDAAYAQTTRKLSSSTNLRGTGETMTEIEMLREGYQILSDPARRAKYNATLVEAETGVTLMHFPDDSVGNRKLALQVLILLALTAAFAGIVYSQMERKIEAVRAEHRQAVERRREKENRPIVLDATRDSLPIQAPPKAEKSAENRQK